MNTPNLIQAVSEKDFDLDRFVQLSVEDEQVRDELIRQMLRDDDIMIYYHCFYVNAKASEERPELFTKYWNEVASLLKHKNSYHRDFALTILANLTKVDDPDHSIKQVLPDYLEILHDPKFMTARFCVQNIRKILRYQSSLRGEIIPILIHIDTVCSYPEKQKALLKFDVLEILDEFYFEFCSQTEVREFIHAECSSISPKTRKKAKELIEQYG